MLHSFKYMLGLYLLAICGSLVYGQVQSSQSPAEKSSLSEAEEIHQNAEFQEYFKQLSPEEQAVVTRNLSADWFLRSQLPIKRITHSDAMTISWREQDFPIILNDETRFSRFRNYRVTLFSLENGKLEAYPIENPPKFNSVAYFHAVIPRAPVESLYVLIEAPYRDEDRTLVWFRPYDRFVLRTLGEESYYELIESDEAVSETVQHVYPAPNYQLLDPQLEQKGDYVIKDAADSALPGSALQLYFNFPGIGKYKVWESDPTEDGRLRLAYHGNLPWPDGYPSGKPGKTFDWRISHPELGQVRDWPNKMRDEGYSQLTFPRSIDGDGLRFTGVVRDMNGESVPDALVSFSMEKYSDRPLAMVRTDNEGEYAIERPGRVDSGFVRVEAKGLKTSQGNPVKSGSRGTIQLEPVQMLTLSLTGLEPRLIQDRSLEIEYEIREGQNRYQNRLDGRFKTDHEGKLEIEHPGPGFLKVRIVRLPVANIKLTGEEREAVVPMTTPDPTPIPTTAPLLNPGDVPQKDACETRVVDAVTGEPIAGAIVHYEKAVPISTDANGIAFVPAQTSPIRVTAGAEGYATMQGKIKRRQQNEARLLQAGLLTFRVTLPDGVLINDFKFDIHPHKSKQNELDTGIFRFENYLEFLGDQHQIWLPADIDWLVEITARGEYPLRGYVFEETIRMSQGERLERNFKLPRPIPVHVTIDTPVWDDLLYNAHGLLSIETEFYRETFPHFFDFLSTRLKSSSNTMDHELRTIVLQGWEGWPEIITLSPFGQTAGASGLGQLSPFRFALDPIVMEIQPGGTPLEVSVPVSAEQIAEWKAQLAETAALPR